MDFATLATEKRYSCRSYLARPVEGEKLNAILRTAHAAPTAVNRSPQRILVIQSPEGMEKLARCTRYTYGAPMALVVCYHRDEAWVRSYDGKMGGDIDAAIVASHIVLQAADLGLGSLWVGHFDPAVLRVEFQLPEEIVPVAIIDLGYPAEDGGPSNAHWQRRPMEDTLVYESF